LGTGGVVHDQGAIERLLKMNFRIEKYFSYVVIKSPSIKQYYPLSSLFNAGKYPASPAGAAKLKKRPSPNAVAPGYKP
jgi:hypothetical protein